MMNSQLRNRLRRLAMAWEETETRMRYAIASAMDLYELGMTPTEIARTTGLSMKIINEMINQMENDNDNNETK